MFKKIADIFGGNIADGVAQIIHTVKADPTVVEQNKEKLLELQAQIVSKSMDQAEQEVQSAAEIIRAEAQSQSWLPRNVRPLLLLLWGLLITLNACVPIIARFWIPGLQPFNLDPWVYKLTAIGFTGYVTARTWEKTKNKTDS